VQIGPNAKGQEVTGNQVISVINKACKKTPENVPEKKTVVNTDVFVEAAQTFYHFIFL
jgi:hypothetical protein